MGVGSRWAGRASCSVTDLRCPPSSWGAGKATLSTLLSCSPGTQFHRSAEFGGFLDSQRVAMVMITILQGGEHHPPCHQGRGWHLGSLVVLQTGCVSLYPAAPSTFPQIRYLNRSELPLSALFSILSPLKNFPSTLGIRECHSFDASFVLLHQKQNILMEKSQLKGDIHLSESTQLERKT